MLPAHVARALSLAPPAHNDSVGCRVGCSHGVAAGPGVGDPWGFSPLGRSMCPQCISFELCTCPRGFTVWSSACVLARMLLAYLRCSSRLTGKCAGDKQVARPSAYVV